MANNRLYIADIENKKYAYLSKGFGAGWRELDTPAMGRLNAIISSLDILGEADIDGKTSLRFFTEYDDLYEEVFAEGSEWEKIE